jgi:hypothetical protein
LKEHDPTRWPVETPSSSPKNSEGAEPEGLTDAG